MRFFSSCGFGAGTDVEMTNDSVRKSGFGVFFHDGSFWFPADRILFSPFNDNLQ